MAVNAMQRGVGRPAAVLVPCDDERLFLDRQARPCRIARSMVDRCCIFLRCIGGPTGKAAAELGVLLHTFGE